jgi:hypothetical protein
VAVLFARKAITPTFWLDALYSTPCPPGGRCSKNGELSECGPYLTIYDGACVLDEAAAVKIRMMDELLHKYSQEHMRRTMAEDSNPYFVREEQGRPLFYLASVTKVLEFQEEPDPELLDAANVHEDKFLVMSDGLLVGVHPSRFIQGAFYANARVIIRKIARIIAHFVWSVIVNCCSWLIRDTFGTLWYTLIGVVVAQTVRRTTRVEPLVCSRREQADSLSRAAQLSPPTPPLATNQFLNSNARRKQSRAAKQLAYRLAQEAATQTPPLANNQFLNSYARRKQSRAAKQLAYRLAQEAATQRMNGDT